MKKILVVGLYPNEACPKFTLEFARSLKKLNNIVYAVLPDNVENKIAWKSEFGDSNLCFVHLDKSESRFKSKIDKYVNITCFIFFKNNILKNIKDIKFDYSFFTFFHRWNDLIKQSVKSNKYISFVHDPKMHSGESVKRQNQAIKQIQEMDKLIVLSKEFIGYTSKVYKKEKKDIVYMPHCLFYGTRKVSSINEYIDDSQDVNFLFFGRITEYKGIDVLIKAYTKLMIEYKNASLTIAGSGDFSKYKDEFEKASNIKLENRFIEENEIPDFFKLKNCVVVIPYIDATQSGVISIAYSYGNPVIASNTGGLKEQLDNGKLGIFCKAGDVDDLKDKMLEVCKNRGLLKEESMKMIKYSQCLNWDVATKDVLNSLD